MFVRFIKGSLFKRFPASRASQKAVGCPTAHGIHCTRPNRSGTGWLQRKLFQATIKIHSTMSQAWPNHLKFSSCEAIWSKYSS